MVTVTEREEFRRLALTLLGADSTPQDCWDAAYRLHDLFYEIGGAPREVTDSGAMDWCEASHLANGKALDPYSAGACMLDVFRTATFARGVNEAIRTLQQRFPGECIELLYAGTGPFAPLALLQTASFLPEEVRFTLLDIHTRALDCLRRLLSELDLEGYAESLVQADASRWQPPEARTYHLIVAEVMQRALAKEPQVAVTRNLARHLRPDGIFVPERIELQFCLRAGTANQDRQSADSTRPLAAPFALTARSALDLDVTGSDEIRLPAVLLPAHLAPGEALCVLTRVVVFGNLALEEQQSGLTMPWIVNGPARLRPGALLEVGYRLPNPPGLAVRWRGSTT